MKLFSSAILAKAGKVNFTRNCFVIAEGEDEARSKLADYIKATPKLRTAQIKAIIVVEESVIV